MQLNYLVIVKIVICGFHAPSLPCTSVGINYSIQVKIDYVPCLISAGSGGTSVLWTDTSFYHIFCKLYIRHVT